MKIILTSVGTQGDIEPFLAVAKLLKKRGHHVICAFSEQFRNLADESDLEFASLGLKFIELLNSPDGQAAMGGATGFKKIRGTINLALNQKEANQQLATKQREIIEQEEPDIVLYNGKAVYPIIWRLQNKGKAILMSPLPYMHYVKGNTHIAFNSNYGETLNKLTFSLTNFGMVTTIKMAMKWLNIKEKFSNKSIRDVLKYDPAIYLMSPSLFPKHTEWDKNLKVLGYHENSSNMEWVPESTLSKFVQKHDKILFITFGSMINPTPEVNTRKFIEILERNTIPAIINVASGGLVKSSKYVSDLIHFVERIPYNWIFPKVYAVIHHGGSGTTHLALKHGCPTMIIPHIIDQFAWNKIIYENGLGPKGIKIGKINTKVLEPKILDLFSNEDYKKKTEQIQKQMESEDFEDELYQLIIN